MKGKYRRKARKRPGNAVLKKHMAAVGEFVKNTAGCDEEEEDRQPELVRTKSRRELRKEKRKQKKARMKSHYEGKRESAAPTSGTEKLQGAAVKQQLQPKQKPEKKREKPVKEEQTNVLQARQAKKEEKVSRLQQNRRTALLEANQAEDREIKKLERFLGFNKRKNKKTLPQSLVADGLDYILGAIGSSASALYDSDQDLDTAKDKFDNLDQNSPQVSDEEAAEEMLSDSGDEDEGSLDEGEECDDDGGDESMEDEEEEMEDEDGSDEAESGDETENLSKQLEEDDASDAKVPTENDAGAAGRYVPPQLRDATDQRRKAELERLRRNVKGLLNRLSEANMASICGQMEQLYMSGSRREVSDMLSEVLLAACVTPSLMPDRLLMEHVLLVSVLHHTVGLEVGAHFLETVVRRFDEAYKQQGEGKECDNLVAMVAQLYHFQVTHSLLVFDILKVFVAAFTEKDIQLTLFVLKNVGFALRKDDPLALKDLIAEAQRKAGETGSKFEDQTRVRFMLETMLALKNNDMRKIPGYDPEPADRLRRLHRSLIGRSSSGSDVKLRVSLENLLAAERAGRWWIVGSSWSGAPMIGEQAQAAPTQGAAQGQFSAKVLELARKQRMNTEVRRNIFCVLMTSEDYLDAFEKLLRMGLKDKQEREIVHVLLDCCLQEKSFNAFYAVLGEKLCSYDRRFQMTFQFSLWDKFRELPNLPSSTVSNLVLLVLGFLQKKCLSLSILKVIEFGELDRPQVRFLRQLLTKLLKDTPPEELAAIFGKVSGLPKLGTLREGLKLFISHFLLRSAQTEGAAEQAALLREHAQIATRAMEAKDSRHKL